MPRKKTATCKTCAETFACALDLAEHERQEHAAPRPSAQPQPKKSPKPKTPRVLPWQ